MHAPSSSSVGHHGECSLCGLFGTCSLSTRESERTGLHWLVLATADGVFRTLHPLNLLPNGALQIASVPYELLCVISNGGKAKIYKARCREEFFAIKVVEADASDRTQREARALKALNSGECISFVSILFTRL